MNYNIILTNAVTRTKRSDWCADKCFRVDQPFLCHHSHTNQNIFRHLEGKHRAGGIGQGRLWRHQHSGSLNTTRIHANQARTTTLKQGYSPTGIVSRSKIRHLDLISKTMREGTKVLCLHDRCVGAVGGETNLSGDIGNQQGDLDVVVTKPERWQSIFTVKSSNAPKKLRMFQN